jgi:hypothetical protein
MISAKLIHQIEANCDLIIDRVVTRIRGGSTTANTRTMLDVELRELGQDLLLNLGYWLTTGDEQCLKDRAEHLGTTCFKREIPLHRAVRGLCLLREGMLDFAEEHLLSYSSLELYSEDQLNRRMGHFFDLLTIHLVLGYERCLRRHVDESAATYSGA